jgi:hydroxypyruvate isomerase
MIRTQEIRKMDKTNPLRQLKMAAAGMNRKSKLNTDSHNQVSRRDILRMTAGVGAVGAAAFTVSACPAPSMATDRAATKGRIKQSVAHWCFEKYWDVEKTCQIARQLGCKSVELVDPKYWPMLKEYGLVCALYGSHWFDKGMNNPEYHDMCIQKMRNSIDACSEHGFPNVITFTGFREDIPDDAGIKNCVDGYKKIIGYAEHKSVNLCLEILNSRVAAEMKGHPGYQGDHTDYCMEIVRQVGSPRMKLLFDVYHVQIMDGDIIRRIRQYKDYIGHYHVAGNPGRGELDDTQEINYKAIMEEIVRTGYTGYVGQEFIPTRDPLESLRQAVLLCDV